MKLHRKSQGGFSLPELIVTVVVIAILGGLALGLISNLSNQARENAKAANAATLSRMASQFMAAGGTFGATGSAGSASTNGVVANATAAASIASFETGVWAGGLFFQLSPGVTDASYTWTAPTATTPPLYAFTAGSGAQP